MKHTNRELIIKNPEIKRHKKTDLTLKEITEDALYNMAVSIWWELEELANGAVPSRELTVMSSERNKAVVVKLEIHKFSNAQKSGEQIYSLIEKD